MKPLVAIVGRPNVGKSTLFNRITRSRDALVDNFPGVTRDRHFGDARWNDVEFTVVDTGGFTAGDDLADAIIGQVRQAIDAADIIVFLLDGRSGVSPFDRDIFDILRKETKPVLYAVNKIDGIEQEHLLHEFYRLGVETLHPLSAEHRYGLNDFLDELVKHLPPSKDVEEPETSENTVRLAVVGRPNVGKSSLVNRILGEERLLVSDMPGTTRDAVDSLVRVGERHYLLIDTAGIRRKGRVSQKIEKFSIIKALRSLERCDVALIIMDAQEGITEQDISIAGYALERGCACIVLLNKWDLVEKDSRTSKRYHDELRRRAKFLAFAPAITVSALTGLRVQKVFEMIDRVYEQYGVRIPTGRLNRILEDALQRNPPSLHRGRRIKFFYATQASSKPPTFVCFVNYPEAVHFSYKRYLINQIRQESKLDKTPIRLKFRQRERRRGRRN